MGGFAVSNSVPKAGFEPACPRTPILKIGVSAFSPLRLNGSRTHRTGEVVSSFRSRLIPATLRLLPSGLPWSRTRQYRLIRAACSTSSPAVLFCFYGASDT